MVFPHPSSQVSSVRRGGSGKRGDSRHPGAPSSRFLGPHWKLPGEAWTDSACRATSLPGTVSQWASQSGERGVSKQRTRAGPRAARDRDLTGVRSSSQPPRVCLPQSGDDKILFRELGTVPEMPFTLPAKWKQVLPKFSFGLKLANQTPLTPATLGH